jgi:hypothetical protein
MEFYLHSPPSTFVTHASQVLRDRPTPEDRASRASRHRRSPHGPPPAAVPPHEPSRTRHQPATTGDHRASRFSRMRICVRAWVLRPRRVHRRLAYNAAGDVAFRPTRRRRHPDRLQFRGSIAPPTRPLSTLRRRPHKRRRMTRGHRGSLLLRRRELPSPFSCRFIPALRVGRIARPTRVHPPARLADPDYPSRRAINSERAKQSQTRDARPRPPSPAAFIAAVPDTHRHPLRAFQRSNVRHHHHHEQRRDRDQNQRRSTG